MPTRVSKNKRTKALEKSIGKYMPILGTTRLKTTTLGGQTNVVRAYPFQKMQDVFPNQHVLKGSEVLNESSTVGDSLARQGPDTLTLIEREAGPLHGKFATYPKNDEHQRQVQVHNMKTRGAAEKHVRSFKKWSRKQSSPKKSAPKKARRSRKRKSLKKKKRHTKNSHCRTTQC